LLPRFKYFVFGEESGKLSVMLMDNRAGLLTQDISSLVSVDVRLISLMRLILAFCALCIIYIDPSEPDRLAVLTYAALAGYCLYSAVLYFLALKRADLLPVKIAHWADVCWYLVLVALSNGTSSVFFFFFFFAILVASFRFGFDTGLRVTIVSATLFTLIGYATAPAGPKFEVARTLLRPVYLLVLGYMMAYWGGKEISFVRRLALLKDVNRLSNPRFGVAETVNSILKRVCDFYEADTCMVVIFNAERGQGGGYLLTRAERDGEDISTRTEPLPEEQARPLLLLPPNYAVAYSQSRLKWWVRKRFFAFDVTKGEQTDEHAAETQGLVNLFETCALLSLPLYLRGKLLGRVFLAANRRSFNFSDIEFMLQLGDHIIPVIDNIQLLDHLASDAARQERQKISHDIHDSTIQPYIGLKLALEAMRRRVPEDNSALARDVDDMLKMADAGISDLRRYVGTLKDAPFSQESVFVPAVKRQAAQFTDFYGIRVEVEVTNDICISDRLAAEAFQMVREGLSNIRRHTSARSALIRLGCTDSKFILQITNDNAEPEAKVKPFIPKSLMGRARALGGDVSVEQLEGGKTSVTVEVLI
jgi:signal transduction histidine kinase